jgi:spore germination protein KC
METHKNYADEKEAAKLEKEAAAALQQNIQELIQKVQTEYDADIFGFSRYIRAELPAVWKDVENNWDEEFRKVQVDVIAKIRIRNSALTNNPIKVGE